MEINEIKKIDINTNKSVYLALHPSPRSKSLPKHLDIPSIEVPSIGNIYQSASPSTLKKMSRFFRNLETSSNLILEYDGNFIPVISLFYTNFFYKKKFKITLDCHVNSYIGVPFYSLRTITKLFIIYFFKVFFGVKTLVHNKKSLKILKQSIYCPSPFPEISSETYQQQKFCLNDVLIISSLNKDEPIEDFIETALHLKSKGLKVAITGNTSKLSQEHYDRGSSFFTGFLDKEKYDQLLNNSKLVIAMTTRDYNLLFAPREALLNYKICLINDSSENKDFYGELCFYSKVNKKLLIENIDYLLKTEPVFKKEELNRLIEIINRRIKEVKNCLFIK